MRLCPHGVHCHSRLCPILSLYCCFAMFSRMRSEGFSFNFGRLRVESCSRDVAFMSATVCQRPNVIDKALPLGEDFGDFWMEA